ncbi:MAG: DUF47 family protein [Candidatus Bathyarchaeia archaeon]
MKILVLPMENEAAVKRRILNLCQDYMRLILEIIRELSLIVDCIAKNGEVRSHYEKMQKLIEDSIKLKRGIIDEVASSGFFLTSKEAFLTLIFELSKIIDNAEAAGYRLINFIEGDWKVKLEQTEDLSKLVFMVLDEMTKLRETMLSLNFNYRKALEMVNRVEECEKEIDFARRKLDLALLSSQIPIPALLLVRDIVERIEIISDIGINIVDIIRLIAISP